MDGKLTLEKLPYDLTICKLKDASSLDMSKDLYFIGKTDEEVSLVCRTEDVPDNTIVQDDGWRGFRIAGTLDFSLVGILSRISSVLAENKIGIFAVSTFNTDYVLVKKGNFEHALAVLTAAGYEMA